MSNNEREIGYSCDIALKRVVELYASNSEFKRDLHDINIQPDLIQYRRKQLLKGRRKEPLIPQLIKNKNHYTSLTKE